MNALLGGKHGSHSGGSGQHGSSPLGGLASQFLGGHGSSSGSHGGHGGDGKNSAGKLVGQLASSFLHSSSNKPSPSPQNYHGGQASGHGQSSQGGHNGGLAGAVMGGVANMFGNKPGHGANVRLIRIQCGLAC